MATTLRKLLEENPDWIDLDIALMREDGSLDYVGDSGLVWVQPGEDGTARVLVFSTN